MTAIRRVADDELELVRDLHNRFTDQDRSLAEVRSWYEAVPGLFLFAIDGDEPIGVCTGRPRGDREASLAGIGVEPDRRGEGVGTRLVGEFEANAREAGIHRISVASAGGRVDGFYVENGFEPEKILVADPAGEPGDYENSGFDVEWDRSEDGSRKCYVGVSGYDPSVLEAVREAFGDDHAIYVMAKEVAVR